MFIVCLAEAIACILKLVRLHRQKVILLGLLHRCYSGLLIKLLTGEFIGHATRNMRSGQFTVNLLKILDVPLFLSQKLLRIEFYLRKNLRTSISWGTIVMK